MNSKVSFGASGPGGGCTGCVGPNIPWTPQRLEEGDGFWPPTPPPPPALFEGPKCSRGQNVRGVSGSRTAPGRPPWKSASESEGPAYYSEPACQSSGEDASSVDTGGTDYSCSPDEQCDIVIGIPDHNDLSELTEGVYEPLSTVLHPTPLFAHHPARVRVFGLFRARARVCVCSHPVTGGLPETGIRYALRQVSKLASSLLFSDTDTEINLTSRGAPVSLSLSGARRR